MHTSPLRQMTLPEEVDGMTDGVDPVDAKGVASDSPPQPYLEITQGKYGIRSVSFLRDLKFQFLRTSTWNLRNSPSLLEITEGIRSASSSRLHHFSFVDNPKLQIYMASAHRTFEMGTSLATGG